MTEHDEYGAFAQAPRHVHPGYLALGYYIFIIAIITLLPFDFRLDAPPNAAAWPDAIDLIANTVLFVPVGFLFAWLMSERARPSHCQHRGLELA
jgi:hypothetical protein